MRINTKVVVDLETGEILERESYEYSGPIESCDPVTLGVIAAITSIAGTGTGLGLQLANQPDSPKPPAATTPAAPTPQQQAQTALQQKAAVSQQLPTIEGLTSGFANPEYYGQQGAIAAGVAGQPGGTGSAARAVEAAFGLPPGSLAGGGSNATPAKFTPAGTGTSSSGAFPTGPADLSEFVSTFFKG